jgi:hypothetical protein
MSSADRPPSSRRRARLGRSGVLVTAAAVTVLAAAPGAALAAPGRSAPPDVVPLVDCVTVDPDGTWTAVFGYDNRTGATVTIPVGPANQVTPAAYGDPQPTTFAPGVHHGAFAAVVTQGGGPMWHLGSDDLAARSTDTACPTATQMPSDGNGTGVVIVLGLAGAVGAVLVSRARRRRSPARTGHERVDLPAAGE